MASPAGAARAASEAFAPDRACESTEGLFAFPTRSSGADEQRLPEVVGASSLLLEFDDKLLFQLELLILSCFPRNAFVKHLSLVHLSLVPRHAGDPAGPCPGSGSQRTTRPAASASSARSG